MTQRASAYERVRLHRIDGGEVAAHWTEDQVAAEEPMELRLLTDRQRHTVAVTMRTPGHDFDLAVGYLFSEGVLQPGEVEGVSYCVDKDVGEDQRFNIVNVKLRPGAHPEVAHLERHVTGTSACGVCGKASLDAVARDIAPVTSTARLRAEIAVTLPEQIRVAQAVFDRTGGLHAAARCSLDGEVLAVREDIGRHNAVDKLVGASVLANEFPDRLPWSDQVVVVSSRASFELVTKTAAAGSPFLVAVSAPSGLAIATARRLGVTLLAFVRGGTANIYTHPERVTGRTTGADGH